jgi:hypothetical protein
MGEVKNSLIDPLVSGMTDFVQKEGPYNGQGEIEHQADKIYSQGIAKHEEKPGISEKVKKMLKSDPFTLKYPYPGIVILKSDNQHPHGGITEYNKKKQARQQ